MQDHIYNAADNKIQIDFKKKPFKNVRVELLGCVIMFILIALSNAGGLSGAGSNIPVMLIFF